MQGDKSAVSWAAVVLFLDTIGVSPRTSLSDSFLCWQLLLFDVVRPLWWYADITLGTVALDTPQRLAVLVRDAPVRRAPTKCPLFICLNCELQYFMCSCAIALLIQPSHFALTDCDTGM